MKLHFYIAKHVFFIMLAVLAVIMSIDLVFGIIGEARAIGLHGYTWHNAILYILLRLPSDMTLIFPIAGFLGTLIALLILSSKSELIAMRVSGFSLRQIAGAVMITGVSTLIFYYVLSLFLAPYARHLSYLEQNTHGSDQNILILSTETWLKSGNHFLLMGEVLPDGEINNVTDFVVQNGALEEVRKIKSIILHPNETWTLNDVSIMQLSKTGATKTHSEHITESSLISETLLPALAMEPDEMMIHTLASYITFRKQNSLNVKSYELQFWDRIFNPLTLPILMLIAIPFGMSHNRGSIQYRIVASLVVGFAFYIIDQFFGSITMLSPLPAILGAALPPLLFGLLTLGLFRSRR